MVALNAPSVEVGDPVKERAAGRATLRVEKVALPKEVAAREARGALLRV